MVRMKKITYEDKLIKCEIYPEGSETAGHLVYDKEKREVVEYSLPNDDKGKPYGYTYIHFAVRELDRIIDSGKTPESATNMWY